MSKPESKDYERLLDLGRGLAVYKVHADALRERDINARVMNQDTFATLQNTIKEDGRLESLPFCYINKREDRDEFGIISGHHRVRAARKAGIKHIFVLVDESDLSEDEITSKQIAHNAIAGHDDQETLKRLYSSIDDLNQKLRTSLSDDDFKDITQNVKFDEISVEFEYEILNMLFLKHGFTRFEKIIEYCDENATKYAAAYEAFEPMKEQLKTVFKDEKIKNVTSAILKMCELIELYYIEKHNFQKQREEEALANMEEKMNKEKKNKKKG